MTLGFNILVYFISTVKCYIVEPETAVISLFSKQQDCSHIELGTVSGQLSSDIDRPFTHVAYNRRLFMLGSLTVRLVCLSSVPTITNSGLMKKN